MISFFSLATLSLAYLVLADPKPAPESRDSPNDIMYMCTFIDSPIRGGGAFWSDDGFVTGAVSVAGDEGTNLPYVYSINEKPVPVTGKCAGTGDVFNPYFGELNAPTWAKSDIGDLSGKHGKIDKKYYCKEYDDPFLSIAIPNTAFIGWRSLVVRDSKGNYLGCATLLQYVRSGKTIGTGKNKIPAEAAAIFPDGLPEDLTKVSQNGTTESS